MPAFTGGNVIACIGWGSLVWNEGSLITRGGWRHDGPLLPIEFARLSGNGLVTLVVTPGAARVPTLWAEVGYVDVTSAIDALAARERTNTSNIGVWQAGTTRMTRRQSDDTIATWGDARRFVAVIWTALKPKWEGTSGRVPTGAQVTNYLSGLREPTRSLATEYVRRAPQQVRTVYRSQIEQELGWLPE